MDLRHSRIATPVASYPISDDYEHRFTEHEHDAEQT
jgi:hypothetical protein